MARSSELADAIKAQIEQGSRHSPFIAYAVHQPVEVVNRELERLAAAGKLELGRPGPVDSTDRIVILEGSINLD